MGRCIAFLAAVGLFLALRESHAAVAEKHLQWWVSQRVAKLEARFDRRPFDSIGWAEGINHAYALAAEHRRPVFIFTYDGIGMDTGRC